MAKKQKKQIKPDYLYQCSTCHQSIHEDKPSVLACPTCKKLMGLRSWTRGNNG